MRARLLVVLAGTGACSVGASEDRAPEALGTTRHAITGVQALEFESTSPWAPGGTTLASVTSPKQQGNASLRVTAPQTYHEISASNLSSVGQVSDKLSLDLRIDRAQPWGTLRAVVNLPSQQAFWLTLGEVSLVGKPVNTFFTVDFPISASLKSKLAAYYNDLEVRWVLNAPAATYHFDNGHFAGVPGELLSADIGNTGAPGNTVVGEDAQTIHASGSDIEFDEDSFRFMYRSLNGDGQVVVKLDSFNAGADWAKVGLMIRDSLNPNSKNALMYLRPELGSAFQYRDSTAGGTVSSWQDDPEDGSAEHRVRWFKPSKWLKMTRTGNVLRAYASNDGQCWGRELWEQNIAFDDNNAFFGVAVTAGSYGDIVTANVSNFSVQGVIPPINASCDRAARDGDFPWSPVASTWVVPPARFGNSSWNYTTTNPAGAVTVTKCDPNEQDHPDSIARRTDGPDHPNCPDPSVPLAWTQVNYGHSSPGWQFNAPGGFGNGTFRTGDKLGTTVNSRSIWLRKTFSLTSQSQKDNLVLWGRWSRGITIYVNGVQTSWAHDTSEEHRYMGLSNAARAALVVGGTNVVAMRLEWEDYRWENGEATPFDDLEKFVDFGITTEPKMANLQVDKMNEPLPALAAYTNTFREFMHQLGMSGAVIAVRKDGQTVVESGIGWQDKNLTIQMPRGAILRLASVDKLVTDAAVVKLIRDGALQPTTPVFSYLGTFPVPGQSPGAGVENVTVESLRTHTSGIGNLAFGEQSGVDEMTFKMGITSNNWNIGFLASWLYSQDTTNQGLGAYSSDGYALLRHVAQRAAGKSLNDYMAQNMGLTEVVVSSERLAGRQPNEAYINHQEPWDRWVGLEDYLALSASAEGFTKFLESFGLGYGLEPDGVTYTAHGGVFGGSMMGTWSMVLDDKDRNLQIAMIANLSGAFETSFPRIAKIADDAPCIFGFNDPRTQTSRIHFIQNVAQPTRHINIEGAIQATPAKAGWFSAHWYLEPAGGVFYRLKNRNATGDGPAQYLKLVSGALQVGTATAGNTTAHWELVQVSTNVYRIRSRSQNTFFLHVQNGPLTAGPIQTSWTSARWNFCD